MAKRKSYWNKPSKLNMVLTKSERSIIALQNKAGNFKDPEHNRLGFDLLRVYTIKGTLSYEQWAMLRALNQKPSRKKTEMNVFLYAMSADNEIKIGLSSDPFDRQKKMQTGNAKEIEILWRLGPIPRKEAHKLEKKLHRKCKRFNIRGEWFTSECMETILTFEPKRPVINYIELNQQQV